jgi:hypothetical protein
VCWEIRWKRFEVCILRQQNIIITVGVSSEVEIQWESVSCNRRRFSEGVLIGWYTRPGVTT